MLSVECSLEALEHIAAAHVLDRVGAAATGLGDVAIDPGIGAVDVSAQQDVGAARLLAGGTVPLQCILAQRAFLVDHAVLPARHPTPAGNCRSSPYPSFKTGGNPYPATDFQRIPRPADRSHGEASMVEQQVLRKRIQIT